ncbi:rRNA maturation RNase YbeY [Candidatus Saccharibacteria bacterium]|nr:rRNA maturation RNase YbeY [Candidatus Saccharibacteria bacterium]MCB9834992.1 rRNA maturation RNase YbeY [Candidatus Nomurabacteria bacterium]
MLKIDYFQELDTELDIPTLEANLIQLELPKLFESADPSITIRVGLRVVDSSTSKDYNQRYSGNDYPTDVLSFAYQEDLDWVDRFAKEELEEIYLGDIMICLPILESQASQYGLGLNAELHLLMVHGLLHLMGYDHQDRDSEQKMSLVQDQYMGFLGLNTRKFFKDKEESEQQ